MINDIELRKLFHEKLKIVDPQKHFLAVLYQWNFFEWFKFGFQAARPPVSILKIPNPLTPEKREALLKQLEDVRLHSHIVVEPDSKLIFVYPWRSAQQRTMIILADSREEADSIFKTQFEECAESPNHFVPTHYVTQLFVDGGESTIIYNN